jgi:hypothetical protein
VLAIYICGFTQSCTATGIIWSIQASSRPFDAQITSGHDPESAAFAHLEKIVYRWVPALAFSCGVDAISTGMIAGRLIYYHKKDRKWVGDNSFYLSIITIFIESAALSLISKILQIILNLTVNFGDPLVVPLCVCISLTGLALLTEAFCFCLHRPSPPI